MDISRTSTFVSKTSTYASRSSSNIASERSLRVQVAPELLRGVPLHECLSGWAKHWSSSSGMFSAKEGVDSYTLSRQTTRFHNFLSHDWGTSRWLKLTALLVIFNSRAAAVASLVVSVFSGILRASNILPDGSWAVAMGYLTFFIFFCFWQRIRAVFKPRMVFLDKLCIAQHDAALKEQGIMGLAAFLDRSEKLTVLWSPRYFHRLWCTYEISTFLRKVDGNAQIEMMPVKLSFLLCINAVKWFIMTIGAHIIMDSSDHELRSLGRSLAVAGPCVLLAGSMVPWTYFVGIGMMEDLSKMPQQLTSFRIQDAGSACCSHNHRHPETQEAIGCDRDLVFATLQAWLGRGGDRTEKYLDDFNKLVRQRLAPAVLNTVGGDNLPVGYTLYMTASCHIPFISNSIVALTRGPPAGYSGGDAVIWAVRICVDWAFISLLAVMTTRLNFFLCEYGFRILQKTTTKSRLGLAFVLSQLVILFVSGFWVGHLQMSHRLDDKSWLPLLPFLILLSVTTVLFRKGKRATSKQSAKECRGDAADDGPRKEDLPDIHADSETGSTFEV
ncbi:unnamed protein product [Symbiodinium sp. CCMP2456]|nr:unnamed protein product [Symbiodinium sp. CCMP2456]